MKRGITEDGMKRIAQGSGIPSRDVPEMLAEDQVFQYMAEDCAAVLEELVASLPDDEDKQQVYAVLNRSGQQLTNAILNRMPGTY